MEVISIRLRSYCKFCSIAPFLFPSSLYSIVMRHDGFTTWRDMDCSQQNDQLTISSVSCFFDTTVEVVAKHHSRLRFLAGFRSGPPRKSVFAKYCLIQM